MAVFDNMNGTYSSGINPAIIEYHQRTFLENVKHDAVHCKDLQKRTIPANNSDRVKFRRLSPFEPITEPLKEGVTPAGQTLSMSTLVATLKPYGRHVEYTDELQWQALDQLQRETAKELSEQGARSLDAVARNALHSGLNVQYAGSNTARSTIAATDKLTAAEVKKAVRTLERNNAKRFEDGYFHAIVSPDTKYDLTSDSLWIDKAKYQDKEKIEKYELGTMMGVKFYESPDAMVFKSQSYIFGTTASIALTALSGDTLTCLATALGADAATQRQTARQLTGTLLDISWTASSTAQKETVSVMDVTFDGTNAKIRLRWTPENYTTHVSGATLVPTGAGASSAEVQSTLVYGKDFAGCISLAGGDNVRIIPKLPGSSGASDPLEQRGTIAWKVKGFCAVILQDAFGVRIEHGATA